MEGPFYQVESYRPRISIGYLLRRVSKLSQNQVEAGFDGNDITFTQWAVLALTANDVADTCTGLARDLGHNSGAMTRVIDQLEERGLLTRTRGACDRRVTNLAITDKGSATVAKLAGSVVDLWNEILADFERDEARQLIALLTKLLARLEQLESRREGSA